MVRAYYLAVKHAKPGEVYNIASGVGITIRELLDRLVELAGVEVTIEQDPARHAAFGRRDPPRRQLQVPR